MDFEYLLLQMEHHAEAIRALATGISGEQACWKPDPDSWSILEVINHLYDEERQDFRIRLDILLRDSHEEWPAIDPQGWVTEREYNRRDLADSLGKFLSEREQSLAWLRGLASPDWSAARPVPRGGLYTVGDMFAAWVAHDVLHLRQLVELDYAYLVRAAEPHGVGYAGDW